ncbi:hypothetical protein RDI58_006127 [Solanum bulbocastanum]|uniref:Uncharacterized protein n=1 Tax=Solanum bulbocastanum TaxID=147425 RepID=A0AAN8U4D9_SOLBU
MSTHCYCSKFLEYYFLFFGDKKRNE